MDTSHRSWVHTDILCRHIAWPCRVICSPGGIIYLAKVTRTLCSLLWAVVSVPWSLGVCLSKITNQWSQDDAFRDNSFPSLVVMIKHFLWFGEKERYILPETNRYSSCYVYIFLLLEGGKYWTVCKMSKMRTDRNWNEKYITWLD